MTLEGAFTVGPPPTSPASTVGSSRLSSQARSESSTSDPTTAYPPHGEHTPLLPALRNPASPSPAVWYGPLWTSCSDHTSHVWNTGGWSPRCRRSCSISCSTIRRVSTQSSARLDRVRRTPPAGASPGIGGAVVFGAGYLVPFDAREVARALRAGLDLRPPGRIDVRWGELLGPGGRERVDAGQGEPDHEHSPQRTAVTRLPAHVDRVEEVLMLA